MVSKVRPSLVTKYIKDRANASVNVKTSELEQYPEEPQFPFEMKNELLFDLFMVINIW